MTHVGGSKLEFQTNLAVHPSDLFSVAKFMTDISVMSVLTEFRSQFSDDEYSRLIPAFVHLWRPAIVEHLFQGGAQLIDKTGQFHTCKHGCILSATWSTNMINILIPQLQKMTDHQVRMYSFDILRKIDYYSLSDAHTEFLVRMYCLEASEKSISRYRKLREPSCPKVVSALAAKGISFAVYTPKADPRDTEIKTLKEELDLLKATIASVTKVINE